MTIRTILAIALLATLAACSNEKGDHAETAGEAHEGVEHSSAGLPEGNVASGARLAVDKKRGSTGQACVDCHGPEGRNPIDASYPQLAGQYADYLAHSLEAYRSGQRDHALMSAQAKDLTDQQIADLAVYFASRNGNLRDLDGMHHQ